MISALENVIDIYDFQTKNLNLSADRYCKNEIVYFVYFLAGRITGIKTDENNKKFFDFKNLTVKRKEILISLFIFFSRF